MKVIIDRFEGKFAVCQEENMNMVNIDRCRLPEGAKEGDVLIINNDGIIIDKAETERLKRQIEKLSKDIWE
ncbi:MAG: DUF3006 domain-containing protein [Bacillota bacterium]|nr:DUF3006 domain-containing protein [Bacillota bacterium]